MAWIRLRTHAGRESGVDMRIALTTKIKTVVDCSIECFNASRRYLVRLYAKDDDAVR